MSKNKKETYSINNIILLYNSKINSIIKKFLNNKEDVEDIKQEVYIKTWKNLHKYKGNSDIWCWIRKITLNTCKDHFRFSKKPDFITNENKESIIANIASKALVPENKAILSERHKLILSTIGKLKPKLREVVILHDVYELTYEQISIKIKCPEGTVKSRLFNARKAIREKIGDLIIHG